MARSSHLFVLLFAFLASSVNATTRRAGPLRVRKEMRNLSPQEYQMYLQGVSTMISVQTEFGKTLFGCHRYKDMTYFITKHAANAVTPTPFKIDLAHFGPHFMVWHEAFELEFENSLLCVVPELKALPYWKMYSDYWSGQYYGTDQTVFPNFAGDLDGDPDANYQVFSGPFGPRLIDYFRYDVYPNIAPYYNGSMLTGQLRGPYNVNSNPYLTRFPNSNLEPNAFGQYVNHFGFQANYTYADWARCANTSIVKDIFDFIFCIDLPAPVFSELPSEEVAIWTESISSATHGKFHTTIGGDGLPIPNNTGVPTPDLQGACADVAASPNEVQLFFPYHANLDRLFFNWQMAVERDIPGIKERLYGMPQKVTNVPPIVINDTCGECVMSFMAPYTDIFTDLPDKPSGYTFNEMIMWQRDYTYDDMDIYTTAKPGGPPVITDQDYWYMMEGIEQGWPGLPGNQSCEYCIPLGENLTWIQTEGGI